jgi:HKD family nuclease
MKVLIREDELLDQFRSELAASKEFDLAMALISEDGLRLIEDALVSFLRRKGRCRILFGIDLATTPDAIARLIELRDAHPDALDLRYFRSKDVSEFHAKFAIFRRSGGKATAIIGSANLSGRGFGENIEASVLVDDRTTVESLADFFEELFEGYQGEEVDRKWLAGYRANWSERRRANQEAEKARRRVREIPPVGLKMPIPRRIRDHAFAFTGRIPGWPREARLYRKVRAMGGRVVARAEHIDQADCLVQGILQGDGEETHKLRGARQKGIGIIGMDQFLSLLGRSAVKAGVSGRARAKNG